MTPDEWSRLKKVFDQAVDLDEAGRKELLEQLEREEPELVAQVHSLLDEFDSENEPPIPKSLESILVDLGLQNPERIGDYRIVRELGRGGAGIVFLAIREMSGSHTAVALKLLRGSTWDSARTRRFAVEKEVLARLNHTGIARFLEWGTAPGGRPYLVMEYVDGEPLDAYCQRNHLDVPQRLELFLKVLDAVHHAHQNSIIHRDLKPGNILVTPHQEIKLLDFGISKLLESSVDVTTTVERRFTPAYASPEQVRGEPATPATDIYALGVILYELIAGCSPYRLADAGFDEISHAILYENPSPPSEAPGCDPVLAGQIGRDLNSIALRALEKQPRDRYASVEELAQELTRYLTGRPLRDKSVLAGSGRKAFVVAALAVAAVAVLVYVARQNIPPSRIRLAPSQVLSNDAVLSAYPSISGDGKTLVYASDRGAAGGLNIWLQKEGAAAPVQLTRGDRDDTDPDISPDGKWVAFRSERAPPGIYLVSTDSPAGAEEFVAPLGLSPRFSPDGKWIAFWTKDPRTNFGMAWKLRIDGSRDPVRLARGFEDAHNPAWVGDGTHLVFCGTRRSNGGPSEEHDFWVLDRDTDAARKMGAFALLAKSKIDPHLPYFSVTSFQWVPEGVVFTGAQSGRLVLWVLPVARRTWAAVGKPYRLDQSADDEARVSIRGNFAAFTRTRIRVGVWTVTLSAASGKAAGKPQPLSPGTGLDLMPSISADGKTVVFLRQRDQGMQPYRFDPAGSISPLSPTAVTNRLKLSGDGRYAFYRILEGARQAIYRTNLATGVTDRVCMDCGAPTHVSGDGRLVLFEPGSINPRIGVLQVGTNEKSDLLRHSYHSIASARLSPDERWVAFELNQGPDGRQILVAPFRMDGFSDEWVPVTAEHGFAAEPWWSTAGTLLYFIDDRDGFPCIWARKWNRTDGKPEGEAFPVQHFHESHVGPLLLVNRAPRYIGLSVARDRLVLALSEISGDIRSGELQR